MPSLVTETEAAPPALAAEHFARRLALETNCADVHDALARGEALQAQAEKMGAKATKAVAAKNMARRADALLAGLDVANVVTTNYDELFEQAMAAVMADCFARWSGWLDEWREAAEVL